MSDWKIKLTVLWILLALNYTSLLFSEAANGVITLPTNENTAQYVITIYYSVILLMVLASIAIKPSISRWPIILTAFLFFILKVLGVIGVSIPATTSGQVNELMGVLFAGLIIWYGLKAPDDDRLHT